MIGKHVYKSAKCYEYIYFQKIILVAETGSNILPEVASKYGIVLIPMHVSFGDRTVAILGIKTFLEDKKWPE